MPTLRVLFFPGIALACKSTYWEAASMVERLGPKSPSGQPERTAAPPPAADHWLSELGTLLRELEDVTETTDVALPVVGEAVDGRLAQVRLGTASSLFAALQCKHASKAGHALRVGLTCSAWALKLGLEESHRDTIEIAALLHDVGVIGVPDHILTKPGTLNNDEAAVMAQSRQMTLEILRQSCTSSEILDVVEHVAAWYDGSREGFRFRGEEIPLGARMIAIVEAFDAMTTDQFYRAAMSQERAMTELFDCAGTQFDPGLVKQFVEFHDCDQSELHQEVAGRWFKSLDPELVNSYWQLNCVPSPRGRPDIDPLYQAKLLENMHDAVVFIDGDGDVILWNRGAERLTGVTGNSICQRRWQPELLRMCDEKKKAFTPADCPVASALGSGVQSLRRLTIRGRAGQPISVDTHAIPVISDGGKTLGAILLLHDASSETSLESRCQSLYEQSTKDPLTQVANRAEFDRVHEMFVAAHQQHHVPCSLIIGDLDRFKQINDTFGHPVGDEVIKNLAALLKSSCRPGDLVARYGGEEFVMLCADCGNAASARRAEHVRAALARMPQAEMDARRATVSFGVTEIQPGDTPETMLRRADRALLMAKAKGRNTVVQLGSGSGADSEEAIASSPPSMDPVDKVRSGQLLERNLVTPVPVKMAIEKLRGFVADHQARIVKIDGDHVCLELKDKSPRRLRRRADRPMTFSMEVRFEEEIGSVEAGDRPRSGASRTRIEACINPKKNRDRRRSDVLERARTVLVSFQSYLMASEEDAELPSVS